MSVIKCLNKAGKAINKRDGDSVRELFEQYKAKGMDETEAGFAAVRDTQALVDKEIGGILDQVKKAGGKVGQPAEAGKPIPLARKTDEGVEVVDARKVIDDIDSVVAGLDDILRCSIK